MEKINVSTLRENLAAYIKKASSGEEITITSHGHDLARLVPAQKKHEASRARLKALSKTAVIGDILSPVDDHWEVAQ